MPEAEFRRHSVKEALESSPGTFVTICGWVASRSTLGSVLFARIRDGSGSIQVTGKKQITEEDMLYAMRSATIESAVSVSGEVRDDNRAPEGKEVRVKEFEVISLADKWPISKSAIKSVSFLYDNRHLAIRGRKAISIMKIRAELIYASLDFFIHRGFHLISAPTLVQSACEGGATLFKLDYFGQPAYLSQSAQLYEEAAICSLEKVFIFQPAFRAEKSKTPKHLTEFWMVEAEQAFAGQNENMKLQEELVTFILQRILDKRSNELKVLGRSIRLPTLPYPRITYEEVRNMAVKNGIFFDRGQDIPADVEKLVSLNFDSPVFVTEYPESARSFYHMTIPGSDVTLSDDLIAPEGYGEIVTGGQRINDYGVLLEKMKKQGISEEAFRWYTDLRRYGLPPHAGFGLGIERTTRWICGLKHIRSASLFPRTLTRITP